MSASGEIAAWDRWVGAQGGWTTDAPTPLNRGRLASTGRLTRTHPTTAGRTEGRHNKPSASRLGDQNNKPLTTHKPLVIGSYSLGQRSV